MTTSRPPSTEANQATDANKAGSLATLQPPRRLVVVYSHADQRAAQELLTHLLMLRPYGIRAQRVQATGRFTETGGRDGHTLHVEANWSPDEPACGRDPATVLAAMVTSAHTVLVLLSADLLALGVAAHPELPELLATAHHHGAWVVLLMARPCLFEVVDGLPGYEVAGQPCLAAMPVWRRDRTYRVLIEQLATRLGIVLPTDGEPPEGGEAGT